MLKRLLPQETSFFDFFEEHSGLSVQACRVLNEIACEPGDLDSRVARIKEIEHKADKITHQCLDAVHSTFITPVDRGHIHRLMRRLDDIIDSVDSAASRMALYDLREPRPELKQFTQVLLTATTQMDGAIRSLPRLNKEGARIHEFCHAVYEAEEAGDEILRSALSRLFREERDPIVIIKWKEVFERLEKATDRCQKVANIVQGIVIEAS